MIDGCDLSSYDPSEQEEESAICCPFDVNCEQLMSVAGVRELESVISRCQQNINRDVIRPSVCFLSFL